MADCCQRLLAVVSPWRPSGQGEVDAFAWEVARLEDQLKRLEAEMVGSMMEQGSGTFKMNFVRAVPSPARLVEAGEVAVGPREVAQLQDQLKRLKAQMVSSAAAQEEEQTRLQEVRIGGWLLPCLSLQLCNPHVQGGGSCSNPISLSKLKLLCHQAGQVH